MDSLAIRTAFKSFAEIVAAGIVISVLYVLFSLIHGDSAKKLAELISRQKQ